ncbi:MAG: acyl-CoA synthetase [Pseudomonadales bacterium]
MYPGHWATIKPDAPAVRHATSGEVMTWRALDDASNRVAQLLRALGLETGDHVSLIMENHLDYFPFAWGAMRAGLYLTCVNRYLTAEEMAYIVTDSQSKAVLASGVVADLDELRQLTPHTLHHLAVRGNAAGWQDYPTLLALQPATPLAHEPMGDSMLYSSGSTGRPKGIKRPLTGKTIQHGIPGVEVNNVYGIDADTTYLSPAPLYHAAPFGFCMRTLCLGGNVVMMEKFDPELSLASIERFQVTHSQWVPTMFVRLLRLDAEMRARHDLSSHRVAVHAAAPCPVEVKKQMMDWWGPILWEYYAGTERNGATIIGPHDWLAHPGSVGRAASGVIHICDEDGSELPTGESGLVYFEQPARPFVYHNDAQKTAGSGHPVHANWTTLGDVGYLDEEGFLYLTDRKAFMIISGGVNIYPREIEDALILHDKVADVAVFGIPNADFGEEVKAVVQPMPGIDAGPELARELEAFARTHLAGYKIPRSFDFLAELPRLPTGKLYKKVLRDPYWPAK